MAERLNTSDRVLLVLSILYMLHGSPYVGVRMPAMVYASIVILLFSFVWLQFSKIRNVVRYLLPLFALMLLDILFYDLKNIESTKDILHLISESMQTWTLPLLAGYAVCKRKVKLSLYFLLIFLSIETVTYVTSIIAETEIPGIVRMNPHQLQEDNMVMYIQKTSMNVGNFNTVYGCAIMIPVSILVVKYRNKLFDMRLISYVTVLYVVLSIYFVYVAQFTTALIGALLMLCTLFCPKRMSMVFFRRSLVLMFFAAFVCWSILPMVLHTVAENIESPIMAERFEGIAISLEGGADTGSEDIDERNRVYNKAISTITETYGIGGWGVNGGGGHSHILDTIAKYGIIGIALLIVYYKGILKLFYQPYKKEPWIYYYLYGVLGATFFYLFNPSELFPQLLFCYPLSAFLINYKLHKI